MRVNAGNVDQKLDHRDARVGLQAQFLPCDAVHSAAIAVTRCLSLRHVR